MLPSISSETPPSVQQGELSVKAESRKQCRQCFNNNGRLLVNVEKDASGCEKHKMNK